MNEQISTLLAAGADHIDVPAAPAPAILRQGRRLRRRGRALRAGAALAGAAAVVAVVATTSTLTPGPDAYDDLAPAIAPDPDGWAVAEGSTIHLGNGRTAQVQGKVKALYYTSAGVMVRTGRTSSTDAPRSSYWVLAADGTVTDFALDLGDRKPGTDPTLPYLAYSVAGKDATHWELVLRDVRTGEVAVRIPYEGEFTWGGWEAPPVALSGDYVYVGVDDAMLAIAWRTGEVKVAPGLPASRMPSVSDGRELVDPLADLDVDKMPSDEIAAARDRPQTFRVVDATTGADIRTIAVDPDVWPRISPDGRHVTTHPMGSCDVDTGECEYDDTTTVAFNVDTGERREFEFGVGQFGWSPDGRILLVGAGRVRSCDADTGSCRDTAVQLKSTINTRISGNDNES